MKPLSPTSVPRFTDKIQQLPTLSAYEPDDYRQYESISDFADTLDIGTKVAHGLDVGRVYDPPQWVTDETGTRLYVQVRLYNGHLTDWRVEDVVVLL